MADQTFSVNCGFFDAVSDDRTYSADDMNRPYKRLVANGVFATPEGTASTDLQVVSAGSGMSINVSVGEGLFADKWFENPSIITITVPSNTGIVPRYDSVLVQIDERSSGRVGNIVYREGTAASSPTPPDINTVTNVTEYRLANIYVAAGATAINNDAITDTRGSDECPWVTSLIYQVDTSTLFQQFQTAYEDQYEQYTEDYEEYTSEQQEAWEQFLSNLTDDLTVSTNVILLKSTYTASSTVSTIPINIASYDEDTDVLLVFINGLMAQEGQKYTINSGGTSITLTASISAGNTVNFIALHSVIAADLQTTVTMIQTLNQKIAAMNSDSGWITFTLENGASAYNSSNAPAVRCVGNRVYLRGAFKGLTTVGATVCTLPVAYRPAQAHTFITAAVYGTTVQDTVVMQITTSGYVKILATSGSLSSSAMISIATDFVLESEIVSGGTGSASLVVTEDGNGNVTLSHG